MKEGQFILFVCLVALVEFPYYSSGVGIELATGPRHARASTGDWCYDDPACDQNSDRWKGGACNDGDRQSPINIVRASATNDYEKDCPLDFGWFILKDKYNLKKYNVTNTGKTINIEPANPGDFDNFFFRWPGKNDGTYTLHSIHFHWGPDDDSGSEHTFDGEAFGMEAHLVHFQSSSYKTLKEAIESKQRNAVAVIGILIEIVSPGHLTHDIVNNVAKTLQNTDVYTGTAVTVTEDDIPISLGDELKPHYKVYHYEGSQTTPVCDEVVQWLILSDILHAYEADVQIFREKTKQVSTFRKIQEKSKNLTITALQIVY